MAPKEELKARVCQVIDTRREQIIEIGERIFKEPELGFKEFKTSKLVAETMAEFGLPHQTELGITGVKGELDSGRPGPALALMGELDTLLLPDHPQADPETGAAHACGHNAQVAGMLGAMMGLADAKVLENLAGKISFLAVPAEEFVEVEYRMGLVREGQLEFLGGKPELIRLGHFDDIDISMMIHTHSLPPDAERYKKVLVGESSNGCVVKMIRYTGRAAHAGSAPHRGINALAAAQVALAAINAQRETFKDDDTIRIHPIITKGGELVNVVPSEVRLETYVRGKTTKAIMDANMKLDRALRAGAMALGAEVRIETIPGYMPLMNDPELTDFFKENSIELFGEDEFRSGGHGTGSTDMGDISRIMPALHPGVAGGGGTSHGNDFKIADKDLAYVAPAKLLAMTAIDLLWNKAEKAKEVLDNYKPEMTKTEYLEYQRNIFKTEVYHGETGQSEIDS